MVEVVRADLDALIQKIGDLAEGTISAGEFEDSYTSAVIIHDDYERLDDRIQDIVELLDNEAASLTRQELIDLQRELKRYLS